MSGGEPWAGVVRCARCERDRRIIRAYLAGERVAAIAEREGIVYETIRVVLRRNGVARVRPAYGVEKFRPYVGYRRV